MTSPAPDWRERKKRATRQSIREAGLRLFAEKGYAATSLKDITDAAEVSLRSFYQHFDMKEDLLMVERREFLADVIAVLEHCPPDVSPMDCHFRVLDELEPQWSARFAPLTETSIRKLYLLGFGEPDVVARYRWLLVQTGDRIRQLFAQRLDVDLLALEPALHAGLSDTVHAQALFLYATREEPQDYFGLCEEMFIRLGADLDAPAVERRREERERRALPARG